LYGTARRGSIASDGQHERRAFAEGQDRFHDPFAEARVPHQPGPVMLLQRRRDNFCRACCSPVQEHDQRERRGHGILLDPKAAYLMRCDRVDFDLGAEALPHRHKGGGIRCLVSGSMELRVEGEPDRVIQPGQAWFESGREPVYARASAEQATSFIRCSILPREIRGQSSIMYVDPKDAVSKPRKYTVFADEPIELP